MQIEKPEKISKSSLAAWRENEVTRAMLYCLFNEKYTFSEVALNSQSIYTKEFDRFIALKLGAIEQLDRILNRDKLEDMLDAYEFFGESDDK